MMTYLSGVSEMNSIKNKRFAKWYVQQPEYKHLLALEIDLYNTRFIGLTDAEIKNKLIYKQLQNRKKKLWHDLKVKFNNLHNLHQRRTGMGENSELGKLHFGGKAKDITNKIRDLHKKIIEQNKALAKKIGAGAKRIAKFKKGVEFKVFLKAMEHNVAGIAVRLLMLYKQKPTETKEFLSRFGDWDKIKTAINKGDHFHKFTAIAGDEDGAAPTSDSSQTGQYVEAAKASVGIIAKIIAFFKKHKKNKSSDDQVLTDMNNSISADSSIPKVDENGKELPATSDPENQGHEQGNEGGSFAKSSIFKNPIVLGVGAAAILGVVLLARKKK